MFVLLMPPLLRTAGEGERAEGALELLPVEEAVWVSLRVCFGLVALQVGGLVEAPAAYLALVRPLVGVRVEVVLEVALLVERLAADGTHVLLILLVDLLVADERHSTSCLRAHPRCLRPVRRRQSSQGRPLRELSHVLAHEPG